MRKHSLWFALSLFVGCAEGQDAEEVKTSTAPLALRGKSGALSRPLRKAAAPLATVIHNPLLNDVDDDDDDTAISLAPSVSDLCQSWIGQLGIYHWPFPNVDAIHGDTVETAGSSAGCDSPQNETTIAVNPENPWNLTAGANDYRLFSAREKRNDSYGIAYTSFDGGLKWTEAVLPHLTAQTGATGALSDMDAAGDPVVAFGPHNTVYYATIVFSRENGGSGITVSRSHDGGLTFGEPAIVRMDGADSTGKPVDTQIFNDKEWIAVDQRSGDVYVTWTQFGSMDSPIVVSKSTDRGQTWSAAVRVNPPFTPGGITAFSSGSSPQVGPDGRLYIAYESSVCQTLKCDQPTDHDAVIVAVSEDGGKTFANTEVAPNYDFPATLTGENFRLNSFPALALDRETGKLYVAWADDRDGQYDSSGNSVKTNGNVFIASSRNGKDWSEPVTLGTDADEVFPAIAAHDGHIVVSFYTRSHDPNGIGVDYAAVSGDGLHDLAHRQPRRLTSETQNPQVQFAQLTKSKKVLQGVFIGDYSSIALGDNGVFHPAWTDFRGRPGVTSPNQDVYTVAMSVDDRDY